MDSIYNKTSGISEEKRQKLWLSDLCVKYGELSVTPSASSLSSSCYSSGTATTQSATDFEIDQILLDAQDDSSDTSSWIDTNTEETASSYQYYWSKSNTG